MRLESLKQPNVLQIVNHMPMRIEAWNALGATHDLCLQDGLARGIKRPRLAIHVHLERSIRLDAFLIDAHNETTWQAAVTEM